MVRGWGGGGAAMLWWHNVHRTVCAGFVATKGCLEIEHVDRSVEAQLPMSKLSPSDCGVDHRARRLCTGHHAGGPLVELHVGDLVVRNVSRVAVVHPTATLSPVHVSSYRANADMLDRQDLMRPVKAACNSDSAS